ncbi:hypothetical protein ACH5RR_018925 [Cinchona calisaya]|uniref:Uncharacterized protein n=1 Tax=Cinchona calisaya TaxID=153742 RepID=A0ABD2ZMV6_9GENT
MEDQCSPLNWAYYYQEEGIDELKHSLLYTSLELETTIIAAREELARKDDELLHLNSLLTRITKERDEAIANCKRLILGNLLVIQQPKNIDREPPSSGTTSNIEDDQPTKRVSSDSSDCDENVIVSLSPGNTNKEALVDDVTDKIVLKKGLPEKGKFLKAVMEAGPLLQTLLLAGPLPQWQHPPPQLSSIDIPPVTISSSSSSPTSIGGGGGGFSKKRLLIVNTDQCSDSSPSNSKYQRVGHQSSLTNNI